MPGFNANLSSGKFEAFKDLVTSIIDDGHKVLVFSQFVQMLHIIRNWLHLVEIPFCYLDGTSKDRFDQVAGLGVGAQPGQLEADEGLDQRAGVASRPF